MADSKSVSELTNKPIPSGSDRLYLSTADATPLDRYTTIDQLFGGLSGSASGITATGATQATAVALTKKRNRIDTVAAGTGAKPSVTATVGFEQLAQNAGALDLLYYPFLGDRFYVIGTGLMAVNAPITIASGNQAKVFCYDAGILTFE